MKRLHLSLMALALVITSPLVSIQPAKKPATSAQFEERLKRLEEQMGKKGIPTAPQTVTCKSFNGCNKKWHSAPGANEAEARKAVIQKCNEPVKVGGRVVQAPRKQCCSLPECTRIAQKTEL
jgi:hypothetical protein